MQEDASQQNDSQEGETSDEEFRAYKWEEVPEGYQVVYEEENAEFGYYVIDFENDDGSFIHYMQNDASLFTTFITFDEEKGYKRRIKLTDELEAYSISDGRRNTIFYEKDGFLFEFMSDQPEETITEFIFMSGILEQGD